MVYALTPIYTPGSTFVTLVIDGLEDGTLPAGTYQFTIFSNATSSIHDLSGNALDGDDNGTAGGDYVTTFTITATATTTVVTPGTASVASGQSATFTATVSSSTGAPSDGFVQFLVNGSAYGNPVPLSGGTAKLAIAEPAGSYTIAARYTGDTTYAATVPAGETTATLTVAQSTATKTATTTAVTPSRCSSRPASRPRFTATVSSSNGTPRTARVQFLVNGLNYGSPVTLSGGKAQIAITEPLGTYTIAARVHRRRQLCRHPAGRRDHRHPHGQPADDLEGGHDHGRHSQHVSVSFGQSVTFTATVSSPPGRPRTARSSSCSTAPITSRPVLVSGGKAQLAINVPAGTYTVAAQYTGDSVYAATVSAAETTATLTVNQLATSTAITPGTASVSFGQSAPRSPPPISSSNGAPSDGFVQFLVNGSPDGNSGAGEQHGTAQLAIAEPMGSYTITAQYLGDANYAATLVERRVLRRVDRHRGVDHDGRHSRNRARHPRPVGHVHRHRLLARRRAAGRFRPVPGQRRPTTAAAVPLSGGTAQLAITEPLGSYAITAQYKGDGANFASSPVSAAANLVVANATIGTTTAVAIERGPLEARRLRHLHRDGQPGIGDRHAHGVPSSSRLMASRSAIP